jgi:hypothetical protein
MGPFIRKIRTAPVRSRNFIINTSTPVNLSKKSQVIILKILFYLQIAVDMETGSGSVLTPEEAARLGDEAAATAAAAATNLKTKLLADKNSRNNSLPVFSGIVQTANTPIPPSERSKLIRINRELQNKPTVLGGGGCFTSLPEMENFHSLGDGRVRRSVLVENMSSFSIATASFTPVTWCCISCSV